MNCPASKKKFPQFCVQPSPLKADTEAAYVFYPADRHSR